MRFIKFEFKNKTESILNLKNACAWEKRDAMQEVRLTPAAWLQLYL